MTKQPKTSSGLRSEYPQLDGWHQATALEVRDNVMKIIHGKETWTKWIGSYSITQKSGVYMIKDKYSKIMKNVIPLDKFNLLWWAI